MQPLHCALLLHFFLYRTNAGLALRATGENPEAVYAAGNDPVRIRQIAVVACGAFAGLGGAVLVLQDVGTFTDGMTGGRGFLALAALIVGRWTPFGALFSCLIFGAASALEVRLAGSRSPGKLLRDSDGALRHCAHRAHRIGTRDPHASGHRPGLASQTNV